MWAQDLHRAQAGSAHGWGQISDCRGHNTHCRGPLGVLVEQGCTHTPARYVAVRAVRKAATSRKPDPRCQQEASPSHPLAACAVATLRCLSTGADGLPRCCSQADYRYVARDELRALGGQRQVSFCRYRLSLPTT